MKKLVLFFLCIASSVSYANSEYNQAVNAYIDYNCDYNSNSLIKDGAKTSYKNLMDACKKGATDIEKFITDWPDFGTQEGIITFQETVTPYANDISADGAYKNQIYSYGVGSWGIGYIQSSAAKANTIKQWKQGKFKIEK